MFRFSSADVEGLLNVSKWLNIQVLLDSSEIRDLFTAMGECILVPVGGVVEKDRGAVTKAEFFKVYDHYIESLKKGEEPLLGSYNSLFSCALSLGPEEFYAIEVPPNRMLVKPIQPVVQMQPHSMSYSIVDDQIYPMARGVDAIAWGIQMGFPTLYQPKRKSAPSNTLLESEFRNAKLFQLLQKWMRLHTRPTPIMIRQKKVNIPVRLGNQCFSWVNNHPGLRFHGLVVENEGDEG